MKCKIYILPLFCIDTVLKEETKDCHRNSRNNKKIKNKNRDRRKNVLQNVSRSGNSDTTIVGHTSKTACTLTKLNFALRIMLKDNAEFI